jgi:hypothetical protein
MGSISPGNVDHEPGQSGTPSEQPSRRHISEIRNLSMPNTLPIAAEENEKEVER